jgi:exonuclease V gamma subunit
MLEVLRSHSVHQLFCLLERAISDETPTNTDLPIFSSAHVVLPNRGLESWIRQEFASKHGVCRPIQFSLPATFLWNEIIRPLFPDFPQEPPLDEASICFRLYRLFQDQDALPPTIAHWLSRRNSKRDQMDLARVLARELDRLLVHSPQKLFKYEADLRHSPAQQEFTFTPREIADPITVLWQGLLKQEKASINRASIHSLLLQQLKDPRHSSQLSSLPNQIHLFMPGLLPEGHMAPFMALSKHRNVRVYNLRPTAKNLWPGESLWNLNAAHQNALDEALDEVPEKITPPAASNTEHASEVSVPSIQVHGCHNRMREAEVVHDALLTLHKIEGIAASDVQVLCVNIDESAPALRATFNSQHPHLALRVLNESDEVSQGLRGFLQMMNLIGSRIELSKFLAPLQAPAFARKFDLSASDVSELHASLHHAGARWGFDHDERGAFTLGFACRRLILGSLMDGVSHVDSAWPGEDTPPPALGSLMDWLGILESFSKKASNEQNLQTWVKITRDLLDSTTLFISSEMTERLRIETALEELQAAGRSADFSLPIPFESFRDLLSERLEASKNFGGPNGSILVSEIGKMRGLPAKIVVLMGFDETAFPGNELHSLISQDTDTLSANKRLEARAQFIDALLCCSDHLIVTATTFSTKDGSPLGWSPVVQELIEAHPKNVRSYAHKLHPFDPIYFQDPEENAPPSTPRRSFKAVLVEAAAQADRSYTTPRPALSRPPDLVDPKASEERGTNDTPCLSDLIQFYKNPAKAFLQSQGISLPYEEDQLDDLEPFESNNLDVWKQRDHFLTSALSAMTPSGASIDDLLQVARDHLRSEQILPPEILGERQLEVFSSQLRPLVESAMIADWSRTNPLHLSPQLALHGTVQGCRDDHRYFFSVSKSSPKHLLTEIVKHIACSANSSVPFISELWFRDDKGGVQHITLGSIENADILLAELIALYHDGQQHPLPWTAEMGMAYAAKDASKLNSAWFGGFSSLGLSADPWVKHLWQQRSFLDADLLEIITQINARLEPLLSMLEEVSK